MISKSDQVWVQRVLMPRFGIHSLRLAWSASTKSYPDLWCHTGNDGISVITVTREFARQDTHERHKRLVHEALHIARHLEHGVQPNGLNYSTYPKNDAYSMAVYQSMLRGDRFARNPTKRVRLPAGMRKPKTLSDHYIIEATQKYNWNAIVADLKRKRARVPHRPPWDKFVPRYYLGSMMEIGPEKDYYEPEAWYGGPMMGKAPEYRTHEWLEALMTLGALHNLTVFTALADPADIYIEPVYTWQKYGPTEASIRKEVTALVGEDYVNSIQKY